MPGRIVQYDDTSFKNDVSFLIKKDFIKNLQSNYNTAPTHAIATLLNNGNYLYAHFGYIPSWANDKKTIHLNARSESIYEKTTFRDSFKTKRCVIPINGYYEWLESMPQYIHPKKSDYFAIAGIYNEYYDEKLNQNIVNIALITCEPNDKIKKVHHRMPVILNKEDINTWLNSKDINILNELFKIFPNENMNYYGVSRSVNKVSFNDESSIQKCDEIKLGQQSLF